MYLNDHRSSTNYESFINPRPKSTSAHLKIYQSNFIGSQNFFALKLTVLMLHYIIFWSRHISSTATIFKMSQLSRVLLWCITPNLFEYHILIFLTTYTFLSGFFILTQHKKITILFPILILASTLYFLHVRSNIILLLLERKALNNFFLMKLIYACKIRIQAADRCDDDKHPFIAKQSCHNTHKKSSCIVVTCLPF